MVKFTYFSLDGFVLNCSLIFFTRVFLFILYQVNKLTLLPPANEVCEGYVFTGVCLSKGIPDHPDKHPLPETPPSQTPPRHTPLSGETPPTGYYGKRPTSGQYTFYWNAFLFEYFKKDRNFI